MRVLEVKLTAHEQGRMGLVPTGNLEAYDYFLRGVTQLWRMTKSSNRQARQLFEQALALDPEYAAAAAFLGFNYLWDWLLAWNRTPQTLERAFDLVQRAIALDNTLPEAHALLGCVYAYKKQLESAITEGEQAITLNPNYADGYLWLAFSLEYTGKLEEAVTLIQQALRLNPHPPATYFSCLAAAYYLQRQNEEATLTFKRALALNPTNGIDHMHLALIAIESGRPHEARPAIVESLRLSPLASPGKMKQMIPMTDPAVVDRYVDGVRKALATLRMSDYVFLVKTRVAEYFRERRTRDKALS